MIEIINNNQIKLATFAGGCFWCMEPPFKELKGVIRVIPGYTGGQEKKPTYQQVSSGLTGHREAIQISYDSQLISYDKLLEVFWKNIDPTDSGGQFADRGNQYKTAIYYHTQEQKVKAEKSKYELNKLGKFRQAITTEIIMATEFYPAEEYHQSFYIKNPVHYSKYKKGSGREQYIKDKWS